MRLSARPESATAELELGRPTAKRRAAHVERTDPVVQSIPYLLQVVARLQTTCFMADLVGSGIHPAESYVIHELWRESPLSQSEISARLEIGNATVGKTIQRLERNGFVERARVDGDRRRIMVSLTARGEAAYARLDKATQLLIADIDAVLGTGGSRRFRQSLHALADHFRDCLPDLAPRSGQAEIDPRRRNGRQGRSRSSATVIR